MGLDIMRSSGATTGAPVPDAKHFRILDLVEVSGWTVAVVHYPGCTTYEGCKLLVYDVPPERVREQTILDPHFLQREDRLSPVARLAPTEEGLRMARWLCMCPREGTTR